MIVTDTFTLKSGKCIVLVKIPNDYTKELPHDVPSQGTSMKLTSPQGEVVTAKIMGVQTSYNCFSCPSHRGFWLEGPPQGALYDGWSIEVT